MMTKHTNYGGYLIRALWVVPVASLIVAVLSLTWRVIKDLDITPQMITELVSNIMAPRPRDSTRNYRLEDQHTIKRYDGDVLSNDGHDLFEEGGCGYHGFISRREGNVILLPVPTDLKYLDKGTVALCVTPKNDVQVTSIEDNETGSTESFSLFRVEEDLKNISIKVTWDKKSEIIAIPKLQLRFRWKRGKKRKVVSVKALTWQANSHHHVAATWGAAGMRLYVDGKKRGETPSKKLKEKINEASTTKDFKGGLFTINNEPCHKDGKYNAPSNCIISNLWVANYQYSPEKVKQVLNPKIDTTKPLSPPPSGMVPIPAGEFEMGSNDAEADNDEQPVRTVFVDAFYMDETEGTNVEYKAFLIENPRWQKGRIDARFADSDYLQSWNGNNYPSGKGNHPVVDVSWYAAMAYSEWAGKCLPTEAEWEYAARGGLSGRKYPHGNTLTPRDANYGNNVKDTTAVGHYPPNGYGLYDMAGNAVEWCLDEYDGDFYFTFPRGGIARNPLSGANSIGWLLDNYIGVNLNTFRVLRGGSWCNSTQDVRVASRLTSPTYADASFGFRCARAVTP